MTHIKQQKNNFITSKTVDIRSSYYIQGRWGN